MSRTISSTVYAVVTVNDNELQYCTHELLYIGTKESVKIDIQSRRYIEWYQMLNTNSLDYHFFQRDDGNHENNQHCSLTVKAGKKEDYSKNKP